MVLADDKNVQTPEIEKWAMIVYGSTQINGDQESVEKKKHTHKYPRLRSSLMCNALCFYAVHVWMHISHIVNECNLFSLYTKSVFMSWVQWLKIKWDREEREMCLCVSVSVFVWDEVRSCMKQHGQCGMYKMLFYFGLSFNVFVIFSLFLYLCSFRFHTSSLLLFTNNYFTCHLYSVLSSFFFFPPIHSFDIVCVTQSSFIRWTA